MPGVDPRKGVFWMVYGRDQAAPTVRHATFEDARAEAERLARKHPGIEFFVMRAISASWRPPEVETRIFEYDDGIPF